MNSVTCFTESLQTASLVALTETDPSPPFEVYGHIYIAWEQNFFDNLSDRFIRGLNVFILSTGGWSESHKWLLKKNLTIHSKWAFSVNMALSRRKWCLFGDGEWGEKASREYKQLSESTFEVSCGGNAACSTASCGTMGAYALLPMGNTQSAHLTIHRDNF